MTSLQDNINTIQDSLNDIKDSIIYKGGTVSGDITTYATDILNISMGLNREISPQGIYQMPTSNFAFRLPSNVIDVEDYALYYAFASCSSLTLVDLSSLTIISGESALLGAFYICTSLISVDLSSLTTISGSYALSDSFQYCISLTTVNLSSLTTISGSNALRGAFTGCLLLTSLSFPSLTSTSFGNYTNQFNNMLYNVIGCTVHFPSNLQSVIGSWSSVTSGFGGINTTILFDLPATT